ncbi:Hypothetical protein YALI2_B00546g [Yarrowia lipolytica]|nr:Hypothetical protein YALI2_B00546g [Yarrowia lipolytica]
MFMKHSGNLDTRLLKAVMVAPMPLYRRFEFLTRHLSVKDQPDYLPMINDFKSAHTHAKQTRDYEPLTEMCSGFFRAIAQYVGLVDDSSSTPAAHERQFNMDRKSFLKDPRQQFLVVSYLQSVAYALRNSPIDESPSVAVSLVSFLMHGSRGILSFPVKFSSVFLLWKIQDWPALKSFIKSYPGYVTARADTPSLVYYRNQMVVEAGCKC